MQVLVLYILYRSFAVIQKKLARIGSPRWHLADGLLLLKKPDRQHGILFSFKGVEKFENGLYQIEI